MSVGGIEGLEAAIDSSGGKAREGVLLRRVAELGSFSSIAFERIDCIDRTNREI